MAVTDRIAVLNFGQKIAEGRPAEVQARPQGARGLPRQGGVRGRAACCEVADIATAYGKIEALKGVSLSAEKGRITCLLGPNGAGKTTLMSPSPASSSPGAAPIRLDGEEIAGLASARIVARGLALVPENRLVFPQMSVKENLEAGAYPAPGRDRHRRGHRAHVRSAFPACKERREQLAGTLSGGEQQMLAVARALMSRPRILLMDEPSLGLAPMVVEEVFRIVGDLNRDGVTIFLVEQNAHMALKVAHHFYLMEQGRVTFSGEPGKLAEDEVIQRAYLGSARALRGYGAVQWVRTAG